MAVLVLPAIVPAAARTVVLRLGRIELVQKGKSLHQQLRVVGQRVAAQRCHILCQPSCYHQSGRTAKLFLNALHHAVNEHSRAHHGAGQHAFFGVGSNGAFGRAKMHLRQLGTAVAQCPQHGGKPRADDTAPEHAVLVHHIKGRGSAKVHRDHRQRKICRRISRIHKAILAHGVGFIHAHGQSGSDLRRDDDRLPAGVMTGALRQRPGDLGHHAGEHSALKAHGALRMAAVRKNFIHFDTIFCSRAGAHRVHARHKAYTSVPDAPKGDGGVAYING